MPRIYVGNLVGSVTSADRRAHLAWAGGVRSTLAFNDKAAGPCRGFDFVEMAESADLAVAFRLNNSELKGARITIEPDPSLNNGRTRNKAAAR